MENYKYHNENLGQIDKAISLVQRDLKNYISKQDEERVYTYTKLFSYLVICWVEVKLLKLVYEDKAFSQDEINIILSSSTLDEKWISALNVSICKANGIKLLKDKDSISSKHTFTEKAKYEELYRIIKEELLPSAQVRNRIAHGQWKFALTNDLKSLSQEITKELRMENIVSLQSKLTLIKSMSSIIHDLAVSPTTYNRDFDKNYSIIQNKLKLSKTRTYNSYKKYMIDKFKKGKVKRSENIKELFKKSISNTNL